MTFFRLHNGWRGTVLALLGFGAFAWPALVGGLLVVMGLALLRQHLIATSPWRRVEW